MEWVILWRRLAYAGRAHAENTDTVVFNFALLQMVENLKY